MENKRLSTIWIAVILAVVAVAIFVYINSQTTGVTDQNPITPTPSPAGQQQPPTNQPQGEAPMLQSNLTADEKAAFAAAAVGSTADKTQQIALATKAAKETGSVKVTGCQLDPAILKVKYQTNFTLRNTGPDQVTLVFYADNISRSVPAGGETSVKADFGKEGAGLLGYYCRAGSAAYQGLLLMYGS